MVVSGNVEKLLLIATPAGSRAALSGNLPFGPRIGESGYVDLVSAGFIRNVGDPVAIGGKLRGVFVEGGVEQGIRFGVSANEQNPHVNLGFRIHLAIRAVPSVARPIVHV